MTLLISMTIKSTFSLSECFPSRIVALIILVFHVDPGSGERTLGPIAKYMQSLRVKLNSTGSDRVVLNLATRDNLVASRSWSQHTQMCT